MWLPNKYFLVNGCLILKDEFFNIYLWFFYEWKKEKKNAVLVWTMLIGKWQLTLPLIEHIQHQHIMLVLCYYFIYLFSNYTIISLNHGVQKSTRAHQKGYSWSWWCPWWASCDQNYYVHLFHPLWTTNPTLISHQNQIAPYMDFVCMQLWNWDILYTHCTPYILEPFFYPNYPTILEKKLFNKLDVKIEKMYERFWDQNVM